MKKRIISLLLALVLCLSLIPAAAASTDTSGHWAANTIADWQQKGYISGYADGSFRPNSSITRAEFIKIMNRVLGLTAEASISFSDVRESDWFYAEIAKAVAAGYAKGNTDGSFRPNAPITRAEAAAMLARAFKLTENEARAAQFKDADTIPAWARGSVGAVAEAGYMTGYPDGSFGGSGNITRAEAVVTADRAERAAAEASTKKPASSGTASSGGDSGGSSDPTPTPTPKIEIKGVKPIEPIELETGITEENAKNSLPSGVTLLDKDNKDVTAEIGSWKIKSGSFDGNTAGSYTFVGTVTIPDGYTYSGGTLTAEAAIVVKAGAQSKTITVIDFSHSIYIEQFMDDITREKPAIRRAAQAAVTNPTGKNKALSTTVTLLCDDGSAVEATVNGWGDFTDTNVWRFRDRTDSSGDYPMLYVFQRNLYASDVSGLPAGYTIPHVVSTSVNVYIRGLQGFDAFKTAYMEAKELYGKLALIANSSDIGNATDSSTIYIVPTGTDASQITKGVQFVATSEANRAYTALNTAYTGAKKYWDEFSGAPGFLSQKQCDDATKALTDAIKDVKTHITGDGKASEGTAENDAYVAGLVKKWLDNKANAPWSEGAVLKPGSNYTLPKNGTFIEGEGLGASTIVVSLEWTLPAELQENQGHLEITQTPDTPRKVTLTAKLTSYRINSGNSITSGRTVGDFTALLGAPISVYPTDDDKGIIPLISGQENKNFTVQIPLRNDERIEAPTKIQSIDFSKIEATYTGGLLTGIQVTGATPDEFYSDKTFTIFKVTMTATAKQLAAVADTEKIETTMVTLEIPHDNITLTDEAKAAGWYIPQAGLNLEGKVKIWHPLVTVGTADTSATGTVTVPFSVQHLADGKTIQAALVPSTQNTFDGTDSEIQVVTAQRGADTTDADGKSFKNYTTEFSNITSGSYALWVKVADTGWVKVSSTDITIN